MWGGKHPISQGLLTCTQVQGFPIDASPPFEATDVWTLHLAEVSCLGAHIRPAGPRLGSLFRAMWSTGWQRACVLSSCPVPVPPVTNEQHLSGEEDAFGVEEVVCKERGSLPRGQRWLRGWQLFVGTASLGREVQMCSVWHLSPNWPELPSDAGGNL